MKREDLKERTWQNIGLLAHAANFHPNRVVQPNAWVGHLPFANWIVHQTRPLVIVELGTHTGNSYFAFCQSIRELKFSSKAYAVDTWQGDDQAGFYGDEVFREVSEHNKLYSDFSTLIRKTFDQALDSFEEKSIDLLHIDGLHTYEAVKHDFESWLPKLKPNAIVLFHDTNVHLDSFGVHKLWSELSRTYETVEFLHSHGLGILEIPGPISSFLPKEDDQKVALRTFFAGLSHAQHNHFERDILLKERDALLKERDAMLRSLSWRLTAWLRRSKIFTY
jgi:Methyltransferase domain